VVIALHVTELASMAQLPRYRFDVDVLIDELFHSTVK
jgi:hypothetical protein